ncbi:MAG TPA: metallophosphoesterase, partial [Puia sp.]|nr:metallophosphoesterase [Puia sp.]
GHYGLEASFDPTIHLLSRSSGSYDGSNNSCPYIKDEASGNQGTVYVVSGSAGQLGGQQSGYPHNAFPHSDAMHGGSCILEVQGNRLELKWICADGVIRDRFTMMKNVNQRQVISIKKGETVRLAASFTGAYHWNAAGSGSKAGSKNFPDEKSIEVSPASNTVYTVKDNFNCLKDSFEVKVQR